VTQNAGFGHEIVLPARIGVRNRLPRSLTSWAKG
jgi:hypothetical protein